MAGADADKIAEALADGTAASPAKMILGVDIGHTGAAALLWASGEIFAVEDLPTLCEGPHSRPRLNAPLLARRIEAWRPRAAYVEFVGSRPGDGPQGAFAFGEARGIIEGVLGALSISITWLTVPTWRRLVGLNRAASKDEARAEAIRRWPGGAELFARVKDADRAEACLIALAGILRDTRVVGQGDAA